MKTNITKEMIVELMELLKFNIKQIDEDIKILNNILRKYSNTYYNYEKPHYTKNENY